jgi:hypothetical protein
MYNARRGEISPFTGGKKIQNIYKENRPVTVPN